MFLLFGLWTLWATLSVVHKSTGPAFALAQVQGGNPMRAVAHAEDTILDGRAKRHQLATECLAESPGPVPEADEAITVDLADLIARCVLDRGQDVGKAARARPVTLGRRGHVECFVWSFVVVARAPSIEGSLALGEIAEASPIDHLGLERAMEAFFLALGLRMARPTVQHADAEPQQPDAEAV